MQQWVKLRELQLMLGLLGLIAVLLLMGRLLPALASGYVWLAWGLIWVPLLGLLFLRRRVGRGAWLAVYLDPRSPWQGRLRGGVLMLAGQALVAAALALALLVSLARGVAPSTWVVLVVFVPIWVLGWRAVDAYLRGHAERRFLPLLSATVLRWLCGGALLLVLGTGALWRSYPDLGGVSLYEAVQYFAARQQARSMLLQHLLEFSAALDGARHWLVQHWLDGLPGLALRLLAWMVVLVQEWLFVWPYLLLCQALTHFMYGHRFRAGGD